MRRLTSTIEAVMTILSTLKANIQPEITNTDINLTEVSKNAKQA